MTRPSCLLFKKKDQNVQVALQFKDHDIIFMLSGKNTEVAHHFKDLLHCAEIDYYQVVSCQTKKNESTYLIGIQIANQKRMCDVLWFLKGRGVNLEKLIIPFAHDQKNYHILKDALIQIQCENYLPERMRVSAHTL